MNKYLVLFLLSLFISSSRAQLRCPAVYGGDNIVRSHITAGGGVTYLLGDVDIPDNVGYGLYGRYDYTIIKGVDLGAEIQVGALEAISHENDPRSVNGNYFNLGVTASVYPVLLLSSERMVRNISFGKKLARSLYIGAGVSHSTNYHRDNYRNPANPATFGSTDSPDVMSEPNPIFKARTSTWVLPVLNLGVAVPVGTPTYRSHGYWSVVLNGQFNFGRDDQMDGYVPLSTEGARIQSENDYYSFFTLGTRYSF